MNAVCPGGVRTDMLEGASRLGGKSVQEIGEMHAIGRVIEPREIADLMLFLASDESSAITGQAIVIDGGLISECNITGFPAVS